MSEFVREVLAPPPPGLVTKLTWCTIVHHTEFVSKFNEDQGHLIKLQDYYARYGVLPSYAGISRVVGFRTKTAAAKLAARLSEAGYIRIAPDGRLAPDAKFFERTITSSVRAGAPDLAEGNVVDTTIIDRYLIHKPSRTMLIRVKGDSMKDAGIYDGDIVVVERRNAEKGDFVVANIEGEFTLKELDFESKRPVLRPHNDQHPVIEPLRGFEIVGVVTGSFRRYDSTPGQKYVR